MIPPLAHLSSLRYVPHPLRFEVAWMECLGNHDFAVMPFLFASKFFNELPDRITMVDIDKHEFQAVVIKDMDKIFPGGWKDLAVFYNLHVGGYIRMVYFGRGLFFIQIFNTFGDEVFSPHLNVPNYTSPMLPAPATLPGGLPPTTLSLRHNPGPSRYVTPIRAVGPSKIRGQQENPFRYLNFNGEGDDENPMVDAESSATPDERGYYLMYSKEMSWKEVTGQYLELPKQFCLAALPTENGHMKIIDTDGTKWNAFIQYEGDDSHYCRVGGGWAKFRAMKRFKLDDFVMFGVTEPNADTLQFVQPFMPI